MAATVNRVQPGLLPHPALPPRRARRRRHHQHLRRQAGHAVARHRRALAGDGGSACSAWRRARATRFELAAGRGFGERNPRAAAAGQRARCSTQMGDPTSDYARRRRRAVPHARRPGRATPASCASSATATALLFDFNHPLAGQPVTFEVQADRGAVMTRRRCEEVAPGRAARLLRRRRPRDRDRRARAAQVRRADLRAPRDRAQHLRGQRPQGQGRDLHRGPGRRAARRDAGLQRARREQGGARRGRGSAASASSTPPARW